MARKEILQAYKDSLDKAEKKQAALKKELAAWEAKRTEREKLYKKELEKVQTQNCRKMGEIIYKMFGEDITPPEFEEMLTFMFLDNNIREYIESEKSKRQEKHKLTVNSESATDMSVENFMDENNSDILHSLTGKSVI